MAKSPNGKIIKSLFLKIAFMWTRFIMKFIMLNLQILNLHEQALGFLISDYLLIVFEPSFSRLVHARHCSRHR